MNIEKAQRGGKVQLNLAIEPELNKRFERRIRRFGDKNRIGALVITKGLDALDKEEQAQAQETKAS
jgi:hypothetical protein